MFLKSSIRRLSSFVRPNELTDLPSTMSAWQICGYSGLESLKLINTVEVPPLSQPNDVLVKVNAASVNALDVMMTGKSLFIIVFKLMYSLCLSSFFYRGLWPPGF
jgi:hypothetical protein